MARTRRSPSDATQAEPALPTGGHLSDQPRGGINDSPAQVGSRMRSWHILGGFMWLYDDIKACSSSGTAADYARANNIATTS